MEPRQHIKHHIDEIIMIGLSLLYNHLIIEFTIKRSLIIILYSVRLITITKTMELKFLVIER